MKEAVKYFSIAKITMTNSLVYFWSFLSKNIFFIFIMFVYLMLWTNIYGSKGNELGGLTLNKMMWYLAVTEVITLSRSDIHLKINEDVKTGAIAYLLNKPYSYIGYCFSYFVGEVFIKLLTNSIIAIGISLVFVGPLQGFSLVNIPFILISILLGVFINFFIIVCLALTSFWIEENSAFFWIYSKLIFTLGGMLMPLELFPNWLQEISRFLPFSFVTYVPAKMAVSFTLGDFLFNLGIQVIYLGVFVILSFILYGRGAKRLNVNGG